MMATNIFDWRSAKQKIVYSAQSIYLGQNLHWKECADNRNKDGRLMGNSIPSSLQQLGHVRTMHAFDAKRVIFSHYFLQNFFHKPLFPVCAGIARPKLI